MGFPGYGFLDDMDGVVHCFCWAHVRRKFFEAMNFDPVSEKVVDWIDQLYDIEHEAEPLDYLAVLRSEKSSKIVGEIDAWGGVHGRALPRILFPR